MPKLKKEKFKVNGEFIPEQTTFKADIELYSYYDVSKNQFYFDLDEMRKVLPHIELNQSYLILDDTIVRKKDKNNFTIYFNGCDTKAKAVALVRALIRDYNKKNAKRMLAVKLQIQAKTDLIKKNLPEHLQKMLDWSIFFTKTESSEDIRLGISFSRVNKIKIGNNFAYEYCDDNWNPTGDIRGNEFNLIEWDEQIEQFLLNMREEMNTMCLKVLDFFNTKTFEELKLKMETTKLLKA